MCLHSIFFIHSHLITFEMKTIWLFFLKKKKDIYVLLLCVKCKQNFKREKMLSINKLPR